MLFLDSQTFKISSNQVIYPDLNTCKTSEKIINESLEKQKPTKNSFVISKCVQMTNKGVSI
jgi:hypothetical protein